MPFQDRANCVGASPELFDVNTKNPLEAWRNAAVALDYCYACPVQRECIEFMDPAGNHYSTVAGGIVWINGKPFNPHIKFSPKPPTVDELVTERFGAIDDLEKEKVA